MPRTIAYLRVSTDEQAESKLGLEAQMASICKNGEPHAIFRDEGYSGANPKRPGLIAALDALGAGDTLVVAKRDRLSRDALLSAWVEKEVKRKKARLVSVAGEGTQDDDPASILLRRIVDAFAEFERLMIGSRTAAAMQAKAARGEYTGGARPRGYRIAKDGKTLVPHEGEQTLIAFVQERREAGDSLRVIADRLVSEGLTKARLHPQSIRNMLRRQSA